MRLRLGVGVRVAVRSMDSVDLRVGDLPDKLRHPAVLVPARPGVDQQRRVLRCQGARWVLARDGSSGPGSACQQADRATPGRLPRRCGLSSWARRAALSKRASSCAVGRRSQGLSTCAAHLLQHPLHPLEDGGDAVPRLGVGGGELAAVGEARLHRRHPVPVKDRHLEAALRERPRRRHSCDAGADHGHALHACLAASIAHGRACQALERRPPTTSCLEHGILRSVAAQIFLERRNRWLGDFV